MANEKQNKLATTNANDSITKAQVEIEATLARCNADRLRELPALTQAIELASGMAALKQVMTDDLVERVFMPLQGSPLGFSTDRDSAREGPTKYPISVVRDVMIEAMIKGLRPVNNEIAIISGRLYSAKNGVTRLVKTFHGLSDLRIELGVPYIAGEKGALVAARATWNLMVKPGEIKSMSLVCDVEKRKDGTIFDNRIAVRVNKAMGIDAILGKATRKIYNAIYEMLTDSNFTVPTIDGDSIDTTSVVIHEEPRAETRAPAFLAASPLHGPELPAAEPQAETIAEPKPQPPAQPQARRVDLGQRSGAKPATKEPAKAAPTTPKPKEPLHIDEDTGEVLEDDPLDDPPVYDRQMNLVE